MKKMNQKNCPICKKTSDKKYTPFCSLRCSQIDLSKWFSESYSIASYDTTEEFEDTKMNIQQEREDKD